MTHTEFLMVVPYALAVLIVGIVVGICVSPLFGAMVALGLWGGAYCICGLIALLLSLMPSESPPCQHGKCKDKVGDFKVLKLTSKGTTVRCRCGDVYLHGRRRFMEVLPDGATRPYLKRGFFRGWKREDEDQKRE